MQVRRIVLTLIGVIQILVANGQISEATMYENAYHYLNDSVVQYRDIDTLDMLCKECCTINGKPFNKAIQVAVQFNKNNRGFPLEDFVRKNYQLSGDCRMALRMGTKTCEKVNNIMDSLFLFWKDYSMKSAQEITISIGTLPSDRKDGYQVFFSDIYKNTLSAELKSFCTPYDTYYWQGSSIVFFFVFDEKGEIKKVYSGKTIHYN